MFCALDLKVLKWNYVFPKILHFHQMFPGVPEEWGVNQAYFTKNEHKINQFDLLIFIP